MHKFCLILGILKDGRETGCDSDDRKTADGPCERRKGRPTNAQKAPTSKKFTFIKSSIYNQDCHSYFIGKVQLIPFREVVTRKHTTSTDSGGKSSSLVRITTFLKK